jgi:hypothetical protein
MTIPMIRFQVFSFDPIKPGLVASLAYRRTERDRQIITSDHSQLVIGISKATQQKLRHEVMSWSGSHRALILPDLHNPEPFPQNVWIGNMLWTDHRFLGLIDWKAAGDGHTGVDLGSARPTQLRRRRIPTDEVSRRRDTFLRDALNRLDNT